MNRSTQGRRGQGSRGNSGSGRQGEHGINEWQWFCLVLTLGLCGNIVTTPGAVLSAAGRSVWLPLLGMYVLGLIPFWLIWDLHRRLPGLTWPEQAPRLLGRVAGSVVSLLLGLVLVLNAAEDLLESAEPLTVMYFVYTPAWASLILLLIPPAYLAWTNLSRIARLAVLTALMAIVAMLLPPLVTRRWLEWGYLLPLSDMSNFRPGTLPFWAALGAMRPTFMLTMTLPYVRNQRRAPIVFIAGYTGAWLLICLACLLPIAVFGLEGASRTERPFLVFLSSIVAYGLPIERLDAVLRLFLHLPSMIMQATFIWAAARLFRLLFGLKRDGPLVWGVAAICGVLAVIPTTPPTIRLVSNWAVCLIYYGGTALVGLLWLTAVVRGKRRQALGRPPRTPLEEQQGATP